MTFNPFTDLNVVYAHRAQSLLGTLADGAAVSSWTDEGEGTHTATQGTAARKPTFHASGGPNNLPYLTFDGTDDVLAIAAVSEVQPTTHFFVFNDPTPADANSLILVNSTTARQQVWVGFSALRIYAGTTISGSSPGGNWRVLTVTFANGAASNAWLELTPVMTNVDAGTNGYAGATYGQSAGGGHAGKLEEAWCIRGDPGSSLRTQMIQYLMGRTGLLAKQLSALGVG